MSEQQSTESSEQTPPEGTEQQSETKTFDAEYVDKLRKEAAKYRTEAKANSEAAKKLAEIEEAQKSETEKAADRIAKAEAEVASVPSKVADALRTHLVALHEIDKDDAELFLTANEPDLLLKQVTRLVGQSDKRKKTNVVPREGSTTSVKTDPKRDFLRGLSGSD